MPISKNFRKRIQELVDELDCKRSELPALIGVSNDVISKAMNYGIVPKPRTLIKIADFFNVSVEYLLTRTNSIIFDKSDTPKSFQDRLEELKAERKLNNSQLSSRLPIDRSYFTIWKRENYLPSLEFLIMLADFFKVSIDYLLGRTDDKLILEI